MNRRLVLVVVAVVLALAGTSTVFAYVKKADSRAVEGMQPTKAYVAQQSIVAGTTWKQALDKGLAREETFPRKTVPSDAIAATGAVSDSSVAMSDIPAGALLLRGAFGAQVAQRGALPVPSGQMAVSISLQDPQHVGSFVQPGASIAVFDTYNTVVQFDPLGRLMPGNREAIAGDELATDRKDNHVTRLLLARVQVLAVGSAVASQQTAQKVSATSGPAKGGLGASSQQNQSVLVTVAVDQKDAEKLILATQTGTLYLGLLTPNSTVTLAPGVDDTSLFH